MTPFYQRSPYAVSKLFAHWITINYREAYGLFACNGILFNHESPVRGSTFVTQKVVKFLCKISKGFEGKLFLGNLYAIRDWGHAKDYATSMWKILQYKKPDDCVVATNKETTVKDFVNKVAKNLNINLKWSGKGVNEKAVDLNNKKIIVEIDKKYFRPSEVDNLKGNAKKAKKDLKWKPRTNFSQLVKMMINSDLDYVKKL